MKKGLKIAAIVVGVLLLLMLILPFAFRGKITTLVKTEGNKMLNAQFDFKSLDISLFRHFPKASVTLSDFWLCGTGEFANDTLIQAEEVTAAINLLSLFGDSGYDIYKIQIDNTTLHAIVLPNGKVNWDIMKPDSLTPAQLEAEAAESPFKVRLQDVRVNQMNIVFDDRQANMYADIRNLNGRCMGDLTSDRTTLQLEAETESLSYRMNGIPFLSNANIYAKMDVDADLAHSKFTLKKNEFRLNAIKADVDGWVAMKDPAIDMDLKMNTNEVGFKEILSLVPALYAKEFEQLKTEGTATLNASAKGLLQGDSIVPQFNIDLKVKDGMFRYPSLPAGVDQINIQAHIQNPGGSMDGTEIKVNPFSFRLAGNPFQVIASVKTPISDPDFRAEAKGTLNLGMIKQVYPLEEMELNGIVNANMQIAGRLSNIEKEQYDRIEASGTVGLTNMNLQLKDMPEVKILQSLLTFTPKYLQLSETTVNIGKNDLTADSRFENYMGYALKGTTLKGVLNVRSNYLNLNDFMGTASTDSTAKVTSAATATTENTQATQASGIIEVPRNIDFQMDAAMKQVVFDQMTFAQMNGKLLVKDGKVDMKNLSMNTLGGNVVMNGYYSTADLTKPQMDANFKLSNLSFTQTYKELNMARQMAPIFENLKGDYSGQLHVLTLLNPDMSPMLPTMQGSGSLSTKDLSLSGVKAIEQIAQAVNKPELKEMKVKDMTLNFTIKEGRVITQPFDLKLGEYVLNLSGSTGLDQTIDYSGKIKLPASAGGFAKLSTIDLKIGGNFTSPKVSLDTKSMANQAVESVAEKAVSELGKKLGLDSAVTANKDSLKQKVTEKATEKVLNFLKKKIK
ncbi:AsmA-like C-terminal region-containing protein [Bacteroides sp.]|uniref:AsmA-like C-terminal region-containing protein n=1 Tax=Bacteroides sp. TaxID=29523 RepID=UPI001B5A7FC1|nr:AsmA-like C-terminal region-containing protein [Bacteroides sp.]MBP6066601.1 AsmA-like C-terminal region-containing protein [Bacteroides sp.]MBP6936660.1 AsmA-like C-terminal region-containing protein [Bacteroides sp.]